MSDPAGRSYSYKPSTRLSELERDTLIELVELTRKNAHKIGDDDPVSLMANLNFSIIQHVTRFLKAWEEIQIAFVTGKDPAILRGAKFEEGGN